MFRDSLMISTLVTIEQPLYMNRASIAIMACGGLQMVERVVGGNHFFYRGTSRRTITYVLPTDDVISIRMPHHYVRG